jgi:hypothetical protein
MTYDFFEVSILSSGLDLAEFATGLTDSTTSTATL